MFIFIPCAVIGLITCGLLIRDAIKTNDYTVVLCLLVGAVALISVLLV